MTVSYYNFVFGVIVRWSALRKTTLVSEKYREKTPNDLETRDCEIYKFVKEETVDGLFVTVANAHDFIETYEADRRTNLPPSYKFRGEEDREEEDHDSIYDPLICIGVHVGNLIIRKSGKDHFPTFDAILSAKVSFVAKASKQLLDISGAQEFHTVPDDCACCS